MWPQVIPSRVLMAIPTMGVPPLVMARLEQRSLLLKRFPKLRPACA